MQRIVAILLLGAALVAQASPVPAKQVQDFAKSHSNNGNAVGVVSWTGKGAGKEVKLGGCSLAAVRRIIISCILYKRDRSSSGSGPPWTYHVGGRRKHIPRCQVPPPTRESCQHHTKLFVIVLCLQFTIVIDKGCEMAWWEDAAHHRTHQQQQPHPHHHTFLLLLSGLLQPASMLTWPPPAARSRQLC